MESITSKVYKTIKEYLRHKTYRRLTIRPRQSSRPIRLSRRAWRIKIARPTIKLQSKPNSRGQMKRSYVTDMLVFLSGGEGGLVSGRRTDKKCIDDRVCGQQSLMSRQVSGNGWEFKRKMMLNVNIAELLSPRRSYNERHRYADLRAVNSFRISIST